MAIFYSYVCLPEGTPNEFPTQNWQLEEDIWKISKKKGFHSICYKVRPASYKLVYNPHEYYSYIMSYPPSQRKVVNLKLLDIGA